MINKVAVDKFLANMDRSLPERAHIENALREYLLFGLNIATLNAIIIEIDNRYRPQETKLKKELSFTLRNMDRSKYMDIDTNLFHEILIEAADGSEFVIRLNESKDIKNAIEIRATEGSLVLHPRVANVLAVTVQGFR